MPYHDIVTKAGVPNSKIFVGEPSFGRTFRMAQDGCWGPLCDFTGSRTQSDANPGRCTKTSGFLAAAEIIEMLKNNNNIQTFYDSASGTDVLLYNGLFPSTLGLDHLGSFNVMELIIFMGGR